MLEFALGSPVKEVMQSPSITAHSVKPTPGETLSTPLGNAFLNRCVPFMRCFYADTLARLLLSFMPLFDFIERHQIRPNRIGSFGAGSCAHETFLSELFPDAQIDCFDASPSYIPNYVMEKITASEHLNFHVTNFDDFDWRKLHEQYDFVLSIQTLEHIRDAWAALENMASTVTPGGLLYIDTPFYSGLDENEDQNFLKTQRDRQWKKNQHFHLGFSHTEILRRLKPLGFEIVDCGYLSYHAGDARFMHFFRNSKLFLNQHADADTAIGLAMTLLTLLRRSEQIHSLEFPKIDRCNYEARPSDATRILARKCA